MLRKTRTSTLQMYLLIGTVHMALQIAILSVYLTNYLYFTNTLSSNGRWSTTKLDLYKEGEDGYSFSHGTQPMATNALNPGAWRGQHEVYLKTPIPWKEISFRFLPTDNSYLYAIFHRTVRAFSAVRFSYSPFHRSALVSGHYTGEFYIYNPIRIVGIQGASWQQVTLKKNSSTSPVVEIWYNGYLAETFQTDTDPAGTIAFRTGRNPVYIDTIKVIDDGDNIRMLESFDNLHNFRNIFFTFTIFLLLLDVCVIFLCIRLRVDVHKASNVHSIAGNSILIAGIVLLGFSPYLRGRYPVVDNWFSTIRDIQSQQKTEQSIQFQKQNEEMFESYAPIATDSGKIKIMIIGASQTEGEGSAKPGEDLVSQFSKLIQQHADINPNRYVVINAGRSGRTATELYSYFRARWIQLHPDILILNIGGNDESNNSWKDLETSLRGFYEMSHTFGFKLIFVTQANNIASVPLLKSHEIMKDFAAANTIDVIDMHSYMASHNNQGIIWWDHIHPTTFGYTLIAKHLMDDLTPLLIQYSIHYSQ